MFLEICIDSLESAVNAQKGGAHRLEVCGSLPSGGLTPTAGLLKSVKRKSKLPCYCMLRSRAGDFCYSESEMEVMEEDLKLLKDMGADGFVFGALNRSGSVDREVCGSVVRIAGNLPCTFHRAIDVCSNWKESLEEVIELGFSAVLTSGQASTALEGVETIISMHEEAKGRIEIMPGSGVNSNTIRKLRDSLQSNWYHGSASVLRHQSPTEIQMGKSEETIRVTSTEQVRKMMEL